MVAQYKNLPTSTLRAGALFKRPAQLLPESVKLNSPALEVMTDLTKVSMISVRAKTSMDKANAKMIRYGIRMLFVLDDNEQVAGLVTANDILGEKPMRFIRNMGVAHSEIMVGDVMTPQSELEVLNIADVGKAKVGDIVACFRKANHQHLLVVTDENEGQSVCGLFSATQIARQLGSAV